MSTIHAQKAIDQVNAERESEAGAKAADIIRRIVYCQNQIKNCEAEIAKLKESMATITVETVDAGTLGL